VSEEHDSVEGFSSGAGGPGANGARRVCRVSRSGIGGEIKTKMVCEESPLSFWFWEMVDCRASGSWLRFANRRRWLNEVSRLNFESRALSNCQLLNQIQSHIRLLT